MVYKNIMNNLIEANLFYVIYYYKLSIFIYIYV